MKRVAALTSMIAFVFLLVACGKDNPTQKTGADQPSATSGAGEIEDYTPPGDVDAGVFEMLRDEFLKALGNNPERTSASAPTGEAGKVTDLAYDPASGMLTWTYVNLGDYNLSGDVSIADVAEVARYYLADATDGEGDDPYEAWVDGSGDGEVNIADVAPLAQNYLNEVAEYVILTSAIPSDGFFEIGRVDFSKAKTPSQTGVNFPKVFEAALPAGALQFVAVEPVDSSDSAGERSNAVYVFSDEPPLPPSNVQASDGLPGIITLTWMKSDGASGYKIYRDSQDAPIFSVGDLNTWNDTDVSDFDVHEYWLQATNPAGDSTFSASDTGFMGELPPPPVINSVSPESGTEATGVQFAADVTGTAPLSYAWDFGGGAAPDTSSEVSPEVTLGAPGVYGANLTVTDSYGSDSFNFDLTVIPAGIPPLISSVSPTGGVEGTDVTFSATVAGSAPLSYAWDFGGGAAPDTSSEVSPLVTLNTANDYTAILTVTNTYGNDSFDFTLRVVPPGEEWSIFTVDPDNAGTYASLAVVGGYPSVAYFDDGPQDLMFAICDAPDGSGAWSVYTADAKGMGMGDVGAFCSLAEVGGFPAVSYYEGGIDFNLKFAICDTADGSGTWSSVRVDTEGDVGYDTSLAVIGGNPAISYYDSDNGDLKYARADTPGGLGTWSINTVDQADNAGWYSTLVVADGNPAVGYFADGTTLDYRFARADTADGLGTWSVSTVATVDSVLFAFGHSAAILAGRPAAAFYNWDSGYLQFAINETADGSGNWAVTNIDEQTGISLFIGMGAVGGTPVVAFRDFDVGGLWIATNPQADGGGVWAMSEVEPGISAQYASVAEVDSRVALAYRNNDTGALKFAIRNY